MIYQTTDGVHPQIRKSGCYFLSVLRIFEIETGHQLTVKEVNQIYKICSNVGYITETLYMKEDAAKGISQVASGIKHGGKDCYIKRVFEESDHNYLIGKYTRTTGSGKYVSHFILMPGPNNPEYDPWAEEGSRTVKDGKFHSPRYYRAEAI